MGKQRLENIRQRLLNGDVVNDQKVVYSLDDMKLILAEITTELKVQDRSQYNAKYYKDNKEKLDKKSLTWYHNNTEKAKKIQKKYREKVI